MRNPQPIRKILRTIFHNLPILNQLAWSRWEKRSRKDLLDLVVNFR